MIPQENKLLKLMSNNDVTFFIPPYQRNYEWTDEQCKVFLDDVVKTSLRNGSGVEEEHFFGSITYFQDETPFGQPNKLVLIDGQQRITTTMLFLIAVRDLITDDKLKEFIDNRYLKNNNAGEESEYKVKLKQVEADWLTYKNLVLGNHLSGKEKESAVYKNYNFFVNKLSEWNRKGIKLDDLIGKGLDKFSVVTIELQPNKNKWENPQEIFESMNSLGKPLSLADLVRNYLLLGLDADAQTDLYNNYWIKIEDNVPREVSGFIRDYMQGISKCSYPKATEANYKILYSKFKKIFEGFEARLLLKSLAELSNVYSCIIMDVSSGSTSIDKMLRDLRSVNVTTAYSFLLMLIHSWRKKELSESDVIEILTAFHIYCCRKRIIGITAAENKNFPTLVAKIPDLVESDDKKLKMFEILSSQENNLRLPNDIEVKKYIASMNFYNFKYCKYILALVEEKLTKSRPDLSDSNLQIEHIMPQKLNDIWKDELGEDYEIIHQENVHNIGNLTLIRHNQELGQKTFSQKKEIYKNNSGLQIAKTEITDKRVWNLDSISGRADWITDYIIQQVLPIPEKLRKTNNYRAERQKHLSFEELQMMDVDIAFIYDSSIIAHVVSDKKVEFEGKKWSLSALTKEIQNRRGMCNNSGAYRGAQYWAYEGDKLIDLL